MNTILIFLRNPAQLPNTWLPSISKMFTIALMGLTLSAHAGKITSIPSASGASGFGGWNLNNVDVVLNGTGSTFNPNTGAYNFSSDSDLTYQSFVSDGLNIDMGIVLAKDWPIGEPPGIKIVNDDPGIKTDKPNNCIMSTAYLKDHYLDSADPKQVICSSPFQTHKRFKVAMLPSTVDGTDSESVDLVFNVEAEDGSRTYEVFQKINNWTNKRLEGFKLEVGFGVGNNFQKATDANVNLANLNIAVPSNLWSPTQLATFSAGLFGPEDKHTGEVGFFDNQTRAGFFIDEYVAGEQPLTDTLTATRPLPSNYADVPPGAGNAPNNQFGTWLPNTMLPQGIFFDDDGNPDTDAVLVAWYGYNPENSGFGWMKGANDAFAAIDDNVIETWGSDLSYTSGVIDDLVNIGLNYVVRIGDVSSFPAETFTIRVTPTTDTSETGIPSYVNQEPTPALKFTSSTASVLLQPEGTFVVGSLLTARVGDSDLNKAPDIVDTVEVAISASGVPSEKLTLVEQGPDRGVFAATLPETFSNVPAETVVTLTYLDESSSEEKTSSSTAQNPTAPILSDVSITDLSVPDELADGLSRNLTLTITNDKKALEPATGKVLLTGSDGSVFTGLFNDLRLGGKQKFSFRWTANLTDPAVPETVEWVASVTVNDQKVAETTAVTRVEVKNGKNAK